jgi:peptidoglycan hydrolase-like protein with peptidoglycan-binding domain
VQDWQARHGWEVASDGTATDPVWESLGVRLDRHSTAGAAIMAAQSILAHKGYQVTVNGTYDRDTETAVRQMQLLHGLPPTGVVDTNTWCATVGGIVRNEFLGIF